MIIVSFGCGLGNQMFEYAFYLSLKKNYRDIVIKADTHYVLPNEHNGFELNDVFGIEMPESSLKEVVKYSEYIPKNKFFIWRIVRFIARRLGLTKKSYYKQKDYTEYYSDVYMLDPQKSYYLHGVWGNCNYFPGTDRYLQNNVFIFQINKLNDVSKQYKEMIESCINPVSIHVRKGDFIKYKNAILEHSYYDRAMKLMEKQTSNITYFVFSDDCSYARELFGDSVRVTYVEGNAGKDNWMDMYLMSICKHNIIANSSFSFWGAYLNKYESKIVIAPNIAFRKCANPFVCEGWISLNIN